MTKPPELPPVICRLFAKVGGRFMTNLEMQRITGWSEHKLLRISLSGNWDDITYGDATIYWWACGITSQRRAKWLLHLAIRRGGIETMQHLKNCRGNHLGVVRKYIKRATHILQESRNGEDSTRHTTTTKPK